MNDKDDVRIEVSPGCYSVTPSHTTKKNTHVNADS